MTELARGPARQGVVTSFDGDRGLGVVTDRDGVAHRFHCIEIADGSRSIEVDTEVTFSLLAKFGRWEAADIRR